MSSAYPVQGWELVEQRGDGLWYAISRDYTPGTLEIYRQWLVKNPIPATRMRVRTVGPNTPPLNASITYLEQRERGERSMMVSSSDGIDTARGDGYRLANALSSAFSLRTGDPKTVYQLARVFAKLNGYHDVDSFDAFLEGFGNGFVTDVKAIAAPVPTDGGQKETPM